MGNGSPFVLFISKWRKGPMEEFYSTAWSSVPDTVLLVWDMANMHEKERIISTCGWIRMKSKSNNGLWTKWPECKGEIVGYGCAEKGSWLVVWLFLIGSECQHFIGFRKQWNVIIGKMMVKVSVLGKDVWTQKILKTSKIWYKLTANETRGPSSRRFLGKWCMCV